MYAIIVVVVVVLLCGFDSFLIVSRGVVTCSQSVCYEFSHGTLELMEDSEGQRHVKAHSHESWANSHIESQETLFLVDLGEAVCKSLILVGIISLHLSLHYVHWVIEHSRAETGKGSGAEINDNLVWDVV